MSVLPRDPEPNFPPADWALDDPNGLLAVGGELNPTWLRAAYQQGIFPWYSHGQPILWWSPDPRMVLFPDELHLGHNLRKRLRRIAAGRDSIEIRVDTAFTAVMAACAAPRNDDPATWIGPDILKAYTAWHQAGEAHSIEAWQNGALVGGLYGVSLGGIFFGESMFSKVSDASKLALAHLVAFARRHAIQLIDCQQETPHLKSLGARTLPRAEFLKHVSRLVQEPTPPWTPGVLTPCGKIQAAGMIPGHEPA